MNNKQNPWKAYKASLIGPSHVLEELPNQDAVRTKVWSDAVLATVSDGVGSAKHADMGSQLACEVVVESVRYWLNNGGQNVSDLLRLIQTTWLIKIRPLRPKDCAATLLWTLVLPGNRAIIAQLGDGAVLHYNGNALVNILVDDKDGFGNETEALRETGILAKWKVKELMLVGNRNSFVLMTDGISEDIEPGCMEEFAKIVDQKLRTKKRACDARRWLEYEFENWSTPHHSDDKTMAVLIQKSQF